MELLLKFMELFLLLSNLFFSLFIYFFLDNILSLLPSKNFNKFLTLLFSNINLLFDTKFSFIEKLLKSIFLINKVSSLFTSMTSPGFNSSLISFKYIKFESLLFISLSLGYFSL